MLTCFLPARRRIMKAIPDCPNARHVEALMAAEHGELNWWSQRLFARAARRAAERAAANPVNAERVALSFERCPKPAHSRSSAPLIRAALLTVVGVLFFLALSIMVDGLPP